jgi:hypothetical protein
MIEHRPRAQKEVASLPPMGQFLRMRGRWLAWTLSIALSGCSLPAPYQTYAPTDTSAPPPPRTALTVYGGSTTTSDYGGTTTTSDMMPDSGAPEPIAAPDTVTPATLAAPATTTPANQAVAVCYNRLWNKPDAVKNAAVQACGNSSARIQSQGVDLDACPVLTPTKAVFSCGTSESP